MRGICILGATPDPTAARSPKPLATSPWTSRTPAAEHVPDLGQRREVPSLFDAILAGAGIQVVLSGIQMPRMNSIIKRWTRPAATNDSTAP
jgi:putative transposase